MENEEIKRTKEVIDSNLRIYLSGYRLDVLSVSKIEVYCKMPAKTLAHFLKGRRALTVSQSYSVAGFLNHTFGYDATIVRN